LYAIGKGVDQNYPEAAKWWLKAAEGGHVLAAQSLSMVYRGGAGVKSDPALSAKWGKFAQEHRSAN
ncbi:MAG TPA: sel1 repeat family protein, partial [Bryobacteraceae bacterium]|nr:sel1 repeat family protein [Bryobacteraceae bacterium]